MDERAALRDGGRNNPSLQPGWRMMEGNQCHLMIMVEILFFFPTSAFFRQVFGTRMAITIADNVAIVVLEGIAGCFTCDLVISV